MTNCSNVFVLETNENSAKIMDAYLKDLDLNVEIFTNFQEGFERIKNLETNPIVIADFDEAKNKDILENLELYTSKIVFVSTDYTTNNIIKAMRTGAKDFLPKPVIKNDLLNVVKILVNSEYNDEDNSKIITIYSNKGGIGKTTIATNLAFELAKVTRDKVALVDLNLQLGDISTFLNLNPSFDLNYVITKLIEKKEDTLLKAFEKYKDTSLYVLADPSFIEQAESITPQKIESLFKALRKVFPYIVIDMSSAIDANSLKILDNSDIILFTSIVNIPAIRNCQRCLTLFNSRHYPTDKVRVIINRYMENDEIKIEDIETAIGTKIYWKIPNNYFSIMEAINKGVAVGEISHDSNIANSFRDFAVKISDDMVEKALNMFRNR